VFISENFVGGGGLEAH